MRKWGLVLLLLGIAGLAAFWLLTIPARITAADLPPHDANLENGRNVFFAGGCAACHAVPKQQDRTRLGGGLGLRSPFGTFYVPNISPDPTDGIGAWSEAQFVTAMIKGTSPAGEHYYPAFPYTTYQRARVADLRDLFAFIKTLPPTPGKARAHDVRFPFTMRRAIGLWKLIYLDGLAFVPDPAKTPEWNRGAYLVESLAHCAECHSPRDALGGVRKDKRFAGGPNPEGEGWVPNITQAGLKGWSAKDVEELLRSGAMPEGDSVGSTMVPVVRNTAELPATDRAAIAAYVISLPPVEGPPRPPRK